ncbi:MAG: hypothetical protein ABIN20_00940 [candidate division WOR-3 bacterium]
MNIFLILLFLNIGGIGYDIFELAGSARAKGMGDAFLSISDDPSLIFYNPAGLLSINKIKILYMHSELSFDSYFDNISVSRKGIGIAYLRLFSSDIPIIISKDTNIIDSTNIYIEKTKYISHAFYLSTGFSLKIINFGISAKFIENKTKFFYEKKFLYDIGTFKNIKKINFAFVLRDIEFEKNKMSFIEGGLSLFPFDDLLISFTVQRIFEKDIFSIKGGIEFKFSDYLLLRAGLNEDEFSLGTGFFKNFMEVDYAFIIHSELPSSHRISIQFSF